MDKIFPIADNNSQVNPEWREAYEGIPTVAESYISLEPDFVYGRSSSFSEKYNTTHDTLSGYGIMSLSSIEGCTVCADVDVVYQDFYNLGRVFGVKDKAKEVVNNRKAHIAAVEEAVERAPDVIIINDCGETSLETKLAELRENPALASVPAIVNDAITSVTLSESFACSMTGNTIEKFAHAFHPDCFQ